MQLLDLSYALQPRALLTLNLTNHVLSSKEGYCNISSCGRSKARTVRCDKDGFVTSIWGEDTTSCFLDGVPSAFPPDINWAPAFPYSVNISNFSPATVDALLTLKNLQAINLYVESGTLPTQLAGLSRLRHLLVRYNCMSGTLPREWRFNTLSTLMITGASKGGVDVALRNLPPSCGISGRLPQVWPSQLPRLRYLHMPNNQLSETLPLDYEKWRTVAEVWLEKNMLSGSIPERFAAWGLQQLRLGSNKFSGTLPSFTMVGKRSAMQKSLTKLELDNNLLTGELHA